MTCKYILPVAVALLLAPISGVAQSDRTDDFIRAEIERQNIPGLSLAVLRNGEIIKACGYGLANIKKQVPATPTTVYKIASVSKQFIAAGIMRLVQDSLPRPSPTAALQTTDSGGSSPISRVANSCITQEECLEPGLRSHDSWMKGCRLSFS